MPGKKWYAIYTKPRWEKKVAELFLEKGIDHYLPLQKVLKQWSDRKKWIREPLFKSYIFVYITLEEYLPSLRTPGVVRFVTFERKAVTIPPVQIEAIKTFVATGEEMIDETINVKIGDKVMVTRGTLKGLEGTLVEISKKKRLRIMIEGIQQSLHIKIPVSYIKVTTPSGKL
jgi:transcription antitermination factor NusG